MAGFSALQLVVQLSTYKLSQALFRALDVSTLGAIVLCVYLCLSYPRTAGRGNDEQAALLSSV
jgi:hypothetical protein